MRARSGALGGILWCIGVAGVACAGSDDGAESSRPTSPSSTTTPSLSSGPSLETTTDDVEAAMRSLLEFDFWTERAPEAARDRASEWLVEDGPYAEQVARSIAEQIEQQTSATTHAEVLEVRVDERSEHTATVLVWMRSDGYRFDGPPEHAFESPPFERTLFVYDLQRAPGGPWRIYDQRIALPA